MSTEIQQTEAQILDVIKQELQSLGLNQEELTEIALAKSELQSNVSAIFKKLAVQNQKFGTAISQFELTVPMDYNHDTWLDDNAKRVKSLKSTSDYNDDLNSKNFNNVSHKLVPGKKYQVSIYPIQETVTNEEYMAFLSKKNALLVGAHGLTLAHSTNPDAFPERKWFISFDKKENLWKPLGGSHTLPFVFHQFVDSWFFDLFSVEFAWNEHGCVVCFCDIK